MSVDSMVFYLALLFAVAAAKKDATPDQAKRLSDEFVPKVRDFSIEPKELVAELTEIMGVDWAPEGEWDEAIRALLGAAKK